MSSVNPEASLPPGFRFHPTDEELVVHYLRRRASNQPLHVTTIIAEVDIYKHDPWKLPDMAQFGDREWYFFTPRDRKYPNGVRPNRAAGSGYWKATGTDRPITSSSPNGAAVEIGVKKALVFYVGKPPKGNKTSWIMHEYRLAGQPAHRGVLQYMHSRGNNGDKSQDSAAGVTSASGNSMRLDDWVLCRIYKKSTASSSHNGAANSIDGASDDAHNEDDTTNNINSNNNAPADGYYGGTHMPTSLPCSLPIQGTAGGDGMLTRPASLSDFLTDVPDYAAFSHLLQDNQHGQLLFGRPLESALTLDPRDHQASSSSTASANQKRQRLLDGNYAVAGYYNNLDGYGGTGGLGSGYHNDNTSALNLNGNMMNNATVSAAMTGFQVTNPFGSGRVGVDQQIIHHHGDLQQHGTTAAPLNAPSHLGFR